MKPFRKNVALAVDGGGMRGVIATRALAILEEHLERPAHDIFRLLAGTSTGSIISAGIGAGLFGAELHRLYTELGEQIFPRTLRSCLWPFTRYRYSPQPLRKALETYLGEMTMGELWESDLPTDVVITVFDLVENRTRFIKPFKKKAGYDRWSLVKAVLASSSPPTYFPPVEDRFVDGGVGSYQNPCYLAAYEAYFVLNWDPTETTLISLGAGRDPHHLKPEEIKRFWPWDWIGPVLGAFAQSADDQQVHLVDTFFDQLDFRRFQIDLDQPIAMDDVSQIPRLTAYGDRLGEMIINDELDEALDIRAQVAPR
ncbi:MAG: patatin-like phospholipase family protein [Anaerolineales bacterium]|nr:patatin-like phospholipase family protein [Anaerolineales bacterium]